MRGVRPIAAGQYAGAIAKHDEPIRLSQTHQTDERSGNRRRGRSIAHPANVDSRAVPLTAAVQRRHAVRWPGRPAALIPTSGGPAEEVAEKRAFARKPQILFARLGSDQQRQFLCCGADALIRYPRSGSSVVGKSGSALKRIFCGVQREALVVFLADRKRIEWNDDGLLVDAQEAADTYHRGSDAAILLDHEIEDVANLVIGRIIYTLFEEIGHGRNVRRHRRYKASGVSHLTGRRLRHRS